MHSIEGLKGHDGFPRVVEVAQWGRQSRAVKLRLWSGASLVEGELCLSQHWSLALRSEAPSLVRIPDDKTWAVAGAVSPRRDLVLESQLLTCRHSTHLSGHGHLYL